MIALSLLEESGAGLPEPLPDPPGPRPSTPKRRGRGPSFLPDPVELPQVMRLLRGAFEASRPASWGRAVLPPLAWHELAVYVLLPQAVYRYKASRRQLGLVRPEDLRAASGSASIAAAPVTFLYVADFDEVQQAHAEEHGVCADGGAGCIVETVRADGARAGLGSTVDSRIDRDHLGRVLGLKATERILLAQSLGYPAPEAPR